MLGALIFSVGFALFLLACLIAAIIDDAAHDPFGDAAEGDWPALPQDLKVSRFHSERNKP